MIVKKRKRNDVVSTQVVPEAKARQLDYGTTRIIFHWPGELGDIIDWIEACTGQIVTMYTTPTTEAQVPYGRWMINGVGLPFKVCYEKRNVVPQEAGITVFCGDVCPFSVGFDISERTLVQVVTWTPSHGPILTTLASREVAKTGTLDPDWHEDRTERVIMYGDLRCGERCRGARPGLEWHTNLPTVFLLRAIRDMLLCN